MNQFLRAGNRGRRVATYATRVNHIPLTWEISISAPAAGRRQGLD